MKCRRRCAKHTIALVLLLVFRSAASQAQVVLDGKFGTSGPLAGPNYAIDASLGATRGNNLFHSFTQFSLKSGDIATFSGPGNIQNILARVTGSGASSIDGTIQSAIAGANLFLINPHGVLFGPHAAVDVSGAFAASTANYLKLANGARFTATLGADDSMLTTDPVVAFGFLQGAKGAVEVQGALKTGPGADLSLVGSTVSVKDGAHLESPGGPIHLVGVSGPGEVPYPPTSGTPISTTTLPAPAAPPSNPGNIVIRGGRLVVDNASVNAGTSGGEIDLTLSDGVEVLRGGQVTTTSTRTIKGGDIVINAPSVLIDGQDGPNSTRIAAETSNDQAPAPGGNVVVHASSVELRRGAEISVYTYGAADAGQVEITTSTLRLEGSDQPQNPTQLAASAAPVIGSRSGAGGDIVVHADSIEIINGAGILANTIGDADAGTIAITAGSLALRNGGITTSAAAGGKGGGIQIDAGQLTIDGPFASITALTTGQNRQIPAGAGGVIDLKAGSLQLLNDAGISATTYGDGKGGDIHITADSMVLNTATFTPGSIPGITAASKPPFLGHSNGANGGDISIVAGSLTLSKGMLISASTSTPADGGSVHIQAGSLSLESESSIQSASLNAGRAGTISVDVTGQMVLSGQSAVSTSAPRSSGGNIEVRAGSDVRVLDSQITAQAGPGGGGNITVMSPSLVYLLHGTFNAQAVGDGGNLTVDPVFFILNEGALISKSSSANGGNITILSDFFLQSASIIDASAPFGLPGTIRVSAPQVDLSGSLIGLPSSLLGIDTQLRPDCGVRLTGNVSSFIVLGRGGLPLDPGGFVPSGTMPPLNEAP